MPLFSQNTAFCCFHVVFLIHFQKVPLLVAGQWNLDVDTSCLVKRDCQFIPYTTSPQMVYDSPFMQDSASVFSSFSSSSNSTVHCSEQMVCSSDTSHICHHSLLVQQTPLFASICAIAEISSVHVVPISCFRNIPCIVFLISPTSLVD